MKIFLSFALVFFSFFAFAQDGSVDLSFGGTGITQTNYYPNSGFEMQVAVQPDGKILEAVSVGTTTTPTQAVVYRFKANGGLDSSFGSFGRYITSTGSKIQMRDIILQPDGKILVCGQIDSLGGIRILVFRLNANGSPDLGFGNGGKMAILSGTGLAMAMSLQPDGKIVTLCELNLKTSILRLTTAGLPDNSFDGDGIQSKGIGFLQSDDKIGGLGIQADGKIVVVARDSVGTVIQLAVSRYHTDGRVDSSFGSFGAYRTNIATNSIPGNLALQPDGKILVVGTRFGNLDYVLFRLDTNGQPDPGFGTAGMVITDFGASSIDWGYVVVVQNDGKIVVSGETFIGGGLAVNLAVLRFNSNGTLDASFGTGGKASYAPGGMNGYGGMIASQGNNIILAGRTNMTGNSIVNINPSVIRITNSSGFYRPSCNLAAPNVSIAGNLLTSSTGTGYQWYLNGTPIEGASNQTYTATVSGLYSVSLISNGCTSPLSGPVIYSITAVDQVDAGSSLHVGPNPAHEKVILELDHAKKMTLELFDAQGRLCYSQSVFTSTLTIDLSKFLPGVYTLRVYDHKMNKVSVKRIVKS